MIKVNKVLAATGLALAGAFVPLAGSVHADTYTYTLNFTATGGRTMSVAGTNGIQLGSNTITLTAPGASPSDPSVVLGSAICADTTHCSITVTDGPAGTLSYNGSAFSVKTTDECGSVVGFDWNIHRDIDLEIADSEMNPFTGSVWFFWNCDGGFCKKLITGLTGTEDNEDLDGQHHFTYHTKWVSQADISDGGKTPNVSTLNTSNGNYRIMWEGAGNTAANDASIDTWEKYVAWENTQLASTGPVTCTNGEGASYQVDPSYDKLKKFRIDPTGAAKGKSIISTNGDRAFRLTIYDPATYFGVTNASNPSDLTYWPDFWDEGMFNPAYDLSGTTAAAPQTMQAYLLGDTVTLRADEKSTAISNIQIASEGVPSAAVTITNNSGTWSLKFNSNYYDKVVFKITSGGQDRYLQINRLNVLAVTPDQYNGNTLGARVYIPASNDGEFDVVATYYYAGGSSKTTLLEKSGAASGAGKNLKAQMYKVPASAGITMNGLGAGSPVGVSFTIVRAGSTPTNYKGTLAGSGRGVYYTFDRSGTVFGKAF